MDKAEQVRVVRGLAREGVSSRAIARRLNAQGVKIGKSTVQRIVGELRAVGDLPPCDLNYVDSGFSTEEIPAKLPTAEELLARRRDEFDREEVHREAKRLIPVEVQMEGPVGILHMGDPHIDDPGSDIHALERDVKLCQMTEGLFAANVGDMQNNWVGRLSHLYGKQSTSHAEAWVLVEWLLKSNPWLYLVGGNHDEWTGASGGPADPLAWFISQGSGGVYSPHGVRINLQFPSGCEVRVNARHDHKGNSQWNTAHGPAKAAKLSWKDHILIAGHTHTSGYNLLKDPSTGLLTHAIKVASYKRYDDYAEAGGFPDHHISPSVITIIDPACTDDDPGQITVFHDVHKGVRFLKMLRSEFKRAK